MKKLIDFAGATIGLVVLSPIIVLCSILALFLQGRPVLFKQARIGQNGRKFYIFKFRTMRNIKSVSHQYSSVTAASDNRITRFGSILRKTKLDELPQLCNILLGDMSFVGPRPEVEKFLNVLPIDCREKLISVRPGITDPSSIMFRNEQHILAQQLDHEKYYKEVLVSQKAQISISYIENRSLTKDFQVLLYTVFAVVYPTWNSERAVARLISNNFSD